MARVSLARVLHRRRTEGSPEGWRGQAPRRGGGSGEECGGRIEAFYDAFGDAAAVVIVEVPDNVTATAVALTVNASGAVQSRTTVLITPEAVDQAIKKTVSYRPPGH
jgi:hypothetical protein